MSGIKGANAGEKHGNYKHGCTNTKLFRLWEHMRERCYYPKHPYFKNYGGRGIGVCAEWRNSFKAFEEYCLAHGWQHGLQIDRVDNELGYVPNNVRFVSAKQNARNKRTNRLITFQGETMCAADWCERFGISDSTLWRRLTSGWSVEDALTRPKQKRKMEVRE